MPAVQETIDQVRRIDGVSELTDYRRNSLQSISEALFYPSSECSVFVG